MKADLIAFAEAYLATWNTTEAYSITHPKAQRPACWNGGYRLMRNDEVKAYIAERMKEMAMEADEVMARLSSQARGNLLPFLKIEDGNVYIDLTNPEAKEYMHLVKKVNTSNRILRTTITGGTVQKGKVKPAVQEELIQQWVMIELHDPQAALQLIGRHHKLFTDKFEHDVDLHVDGFDALMEKVFGNQD